MISQKRAARSIDNRQVVDMFANQMDKLNKKYHFKEHEETRQQVQLDCIQSPNLDITSNNGLNDENDTRLSDFQNVTSTTETRAKSFDNNNNQTLESDINNSKHFIPRKKNIPETNELQNFFQQLSGKNYYLSLESLPQKFIRLDESQSFTFEIINIVDPYEFYINIIESAKDFQNLEAEIDTWYSKNQSNLLQFISQPSVNYNFVITGMMCIVQKGEHFYRALIRYAPLTNQKYDKLNDPITVLCIDYGFSISVSKKMLYPIFEDFCGISPRCIAAKFDKIIPKHTLTPHDNDVWSEEAVQLFKNTLADYNSFKGSISLIKQANNETEILIHTRLLEKQAVNIKCGINNENIETNLELADVMVLAGHAILKSLAVHSGNNRDTKLRKPHKINQDGSDDEHDDEPGITDSASQIFTNVQNCQFDDDERLSGFCTYESKDEDRKHHDLRINKYVDECCIDVQSSQNTNSNLIHL
jgi:hypothetical protein